VALCERCRARILEPLPPDFDAAEHSIVESGERLKPVYWRLLETFWQYRYRGYLTTDRLMDWLYGERTDPPQEQIIRDYVCTLRKSLNPTQWRIVGLNGSGWRLVPATQAERRGNRWISRQ
jgi:hypothetical protein